MNAKVWPLTILSMGFEVATTLVAKIAQRFIMLAFDWNLTEIEIWLRISADIMRNDSFSAREHFF